MIRKFGTNLSINVQEQDRLRRKPPQKKVKVRRGSNSGVQSRLDAILVKSVTFLAGPVGIELEPCNSLECAAKVVRFVDDWPNSCGQARKCGEIKPGDLVLKAQATTEIGTTYNGVIRVLKMSHSVRELFFISASEPVVEQFMRLDGDQVRQSSLPVASRNTPMEERGDMQLPSGSCTSPLIAIGSPTRVEQKFYDVICDSRTPPSRLSSSRFDVSCPSPAKEVTDRESGWYAKESVEASPVSMPLLASTDQEIDGDPRSMSKAMRAMYASIAPFFRPSYPGRTDDVSKKSIRKHDEDKEFWEQVSAIHDSKMCLLQELSRAKAPLVHFGGSRSHEVYENLDKLFQENVALHQKFEEKLRIARSEHEQTELELKKYYSDLCSSKEARIRELEASNDRLHYKLIDSTIITKSHGCSELENLDEGETIAVHLPLRKTENALDKTEVVELDEEIIRLRNENTTLLEKVKRLSSQLASCECCQINTIKNQFQVLRTEKANIQDRLYSAECELSTAKKDLEVATSALLDQLEAQVCRNSSFKTKHSDIKSDHAVPIEEGSVGSIDNEAPSIEKHTVPSEYIIDSLENELVSMDLFRKDEWVLYGGTVIDRWKQIERLSSGSGCVGADTFKVAQKRPFESLTVGTGTGKKRASSFDIRYRYSCIEDFVRSTQKRNIFLEIENINYKKQLGILKKAWSTVKQVEVERDALVESLRVELHNMERHLAYSVVASGDALLHAKRRSLLFAIEKRGWSLEKTWYENSLFHAHEEIERLKRNEKVLSTALSERDRDEARLGGEISSLQCERGNLSFEVGEMASHIYDLTVDKEEITATFVKAMEKLQALHIDNNSLSCQFADARREIGCMEIELHEKNRRIDALQRSSHAQQTDISSRKSLLKYLFKTNVHIVILQQTCTRQRIQHQRDKEQMLLKMARMSIFSGEIQKQNSVLRRKLLDAGNATAPCVAEVTLRSRRELELEEQLAASHLDVLQLQRSQIESHELLDHSNLNMQVACIQVAFLKEAIKELERIATPRVACAVYPCNGDFQGVLESKSYQTKDFQLASLQLSERVLARRVVPMKTSTLRQWHSFAIAKRLHHESRLTYSAATKQLIETQMKIRKLKSHVEKCTEVVV